LARIFWIVISLFALQTVAHEFSATSEKFEKGVRAGVSPARLVGRALFRKTAQAGSLRYQHHRILEQNYLTPRRHQVKSPKKDVLGLGCKP